MPEGYNISQSTHDFFLGVKDNLEHFYLAIILFK